MDPPGESDSPAVAVTSALLGLQGLALLAPLVTKDKRVFQGPLDPQASQVPRVKQEKPCPYLVPLEHKDFRDPQVSRGRKVTEVFLEPQEGRACQERRALLASPESDFQGPLAPKVLMAYPETWDLLAVQAARDLMAYLATQVCLAKRESPELVYQDSKDCQVFLAFLAHLGRRGTSGDQVFRESMVLLAPQAFRESEVTQDRLDYKVPKELQELLELAPPERWAPLEDRDHPGPQALPE